MNEFPIGLLLFLIAVRTATWWLFEADRGHTAAAMSAPDRWQAALRTRLAESDWDGYEKLATKAWSEVDHLPRDLQFSLAAQLGLQQIEYGLARPDRDRVLEGLEIVRANARELPLDERRRREAEALGCATLALETTGPDAELFAVGEEALAIGPEVVATEARRRLIEAAVCLALTRRRAGETEAADRAASCALELCEPRDLGEAYTIAAAGALNAARARLEAGETAQAAEWYDRAEQVVAPLDSAACRVRHAYVLLARNAELPGDPLVDGPRRLARVQRALQRLEGQASESARLLAARAHDQLGWMADAEDRHRDAAASFRAAVESLAGMTRPEAVQLRVEARIAGGQARRAAQDAGAPLEFQLAFDEAAVAEDPGVRALAIVALAALHPMLAGVGMPVAVAELFARAEQVAESLPDTEGRVARVRVEMERASAAQLAGRPEDARRQLRALRDRLAAEPLSAFQPLLRAVELALGHHALAAGDFREAAERFERVLAGPWDDRPAADAQRAEIEWHLASALVHLERAHEALASWRQSFERGRASGLPEGRYASAQSALALAGHVELAADRRQWLEAALALARRVGTAEGRDLAERVERELREFPGGAA